jgi:hypothetical protein
VEEVKGRKVEAQSPGRLGSGGQMCPRMEVCHWKKRTNRPRQIGGAKRQTTLSGRGQHLKEYIGSNGKFYSGGGGLESLFPKLYAITLRMPLELTFFTNPKKHGKEDGRNRKSKG